ncbi:hypothetical protein ASPSYDRAFT_144898 [Aspergillus sydowii CBS 593.65]|jgi:hypothetical protein|uniref:Uncharacterized protein n=1 Tax=Aspergillus sydowii CBS 593.65 TaxID=1036612 RepID=A0A1L9TSP4_9EURO|nr:uncharacterized protein ASPSYDRAFT_144898 [Aspergillus sydowii CBS 593.65]OJJ62459.1 hypothetical protein ASPSYDRAFT_144898 [Aspergillus sydowii CBS 593.65]
MYALIANSFKTTPAVRRVLPCAFYHPNHNPLQAGQPQVHSTTKVDSFYVNPSFPDDSETPPTMTQRRTSIHATPDWAEFNATQSEADVKADRGEAQNRKIEDMMQEEEPKIDEM